MVGCRTYGRTGNFLFQVAATIAYALKHNLDFSIPNKTNDPFWNPIHLQHLVNQKWDQGREDILINENGHEYKEIEFREEWRDKQIVLNGYWQSEKFFSDYRMEILYLFDLPYEQKEDTAAIHVRRGDYLHLRDKHPEVTRDWYESAMGRFGNNFKFKFFSDDISWCRQEFGNRSDCDFSTNDDIMRDLIEGSCCQHQILSSSTFGWWMGWLNRNPNKIVYIPKNWFIPGYSLETKDIVPLSWYKI